MVFSILYPTSFLLSRLVIGVRARQKSRGDSELPWNIPRLNDMVSVLMVPLVVRKWIFVCHCVMIVFMKCWVLLSILYIWRHSRIHSWGTLLYAFL